MLVNLHVKNLAIIEETEVDFRKHLNILTGETGAGKSILVGSINIALGARISSEIIRKGEEYALVELVFQIENPTTLNQLRQMGIDVQDDQVIISRKIMNARSINKINGETVPVSVIKDVASLCIDLYGQHEHQSLLNKKKHCEVLDRFISDNIKEELSQLSKAHTQYRELVDELHKDHMSEEERARELSFLQYEKDEIEKAKLVENEEEELEQEYRRLNHASTIIEAMNTVNRLLGDDGASNQIGRSVRELNAVSEFDEQVEGIAGQLTQIDDLLNDINRDISSYMDDFDFDESQLRDIENRLDVIRTIKSKYGKDVSSVQAYYESISAKINHYLDFADYYDDLQNQIDKLLAKMETLAEKISDERKKGAKVLSQLIEKALLDLNFLDARFSIDFQRKEQITADGFDDVEFLISTNPGEELKPLQKVASGGELSRVMLAIKSVFANSDEIETLVFDEIDTGISGRTAQKVSEKMSVLGQNHQIICITHLAQIAAMADTHFLIEKTAEKEVTRTSIRRLAHRESIEELARILGGAQITDNVLANAEEMKQLADQLKNY